MTSTASEGRSKTPLETMIRRIESDTRLDTPAKAAAERAHHLLSPGPLKDALSGTWLGHALHPLLTDLVIGSFTSATVLDLIGGRRARRASQRLIVLGIASYPPTALTGVSDWSDSEAVDARVRRAGITHAATNAAALSLYAVSLIARRRGNHGRGVVFGMAGATVLMGGGYLGGHLSLRRGVGPDQTVFAPGPSEWTPAATVAELEEGRPTRVVVGEAPILLLKDRGRIFALHDRCSHRGCSLSNGELDGDHIVCSCHGSRFDLRDGSLTRGPATAPQPAFELREQDGTIEIRALAPATA